MIHRSGAAAALLVITVACGCGHQSAVVTAASAPTHESNPQTVLGDEEILAQVREVASHLGEPNPEEIQWVHASGLNEPARLIHGDGTVIATPEDDVPVVFVSARGEFALAGDVTPTPDGLAPTAPTTHPALYVSLSEATGEVIATDVSSIIVDDLTSLGQVHRP